MSGLRELKNRLRSITTTQQMASAMSTVASAKFARVGAVRTAYGPYAQFQTQLRSRLGTAGIDAQPEEGAPPCYVLLSNSRGLCGGFNSELFSYFQALWATEGPKMLLVCGKKGIEYCHERKIPIDTELSMPDIPSYDDARELTSRLLELWHSGKVSQVTFVYQRFVNTMTQTPDIRTILPVEAAAATDEELDTDILYLPDRETVLDQLALSCLESEVFSLLLDHSAGAQSATLISMRSACDNAKDSAAKLQLTINQRRQSEVTTSVIETASSNFAQF